MPIEQPTAEQQEQFDREQAQHAIDVSDYVEGDPVADEPAVDPQADPEPEDEVTYANEAAAWRILAKKFYDYGADNDELNQ